MKPRGIDTASEWLLTSKRYAFAPLSGTALAATAVLALAPTGATAQEGTPPVPSESTADSTSELEAVVVTARRREEKAQDVPATLNVYTADALTQDAVVSTVDLPTLSPSLTIAPADREVNVAIRGVSNNVRSIAADPSNAVSLNGVYLPQSEEILADLFDLSRIEVLKGPQFLYGRNSSGGAINIITSEPLTGFHADGFLGTGSNDLFRAQGELTGGNDLIAARIAFDHGRDDGYTHDVYNHTNFDDLNYNAVRATVKVTPTDNFYATAFWQYSVDHSGYGYGISADPNVAGLPSSADVYGTEPSSTERINPREIRVDAPQFAHRNGNVGALTLNYDLDNVTLRSITGYTNYRDTESQDTDGTSNNFEYQATRTSYSSESEELQLFNRHGGLFDWILGTFLYTDSGSEFINYQLDSAGFGGPFEAVVPTSATAHSQAAYGQITFHPASDFAVSVGGRYTNDFKHGLRIGAINNGVDLNVSTHSSAFTPSVQVQWTPREDTNLYASITKGYKSGGLDMLDTSGKPAFRPESIWAYEIGAKSQWLDRRLTFNLSAFYYDYRDIQLKTVFDAGGTIFNAVTNASSAKIDGAELYSDFRLGAGFSADASVGYLHTDVRNYTSPYYGTTLNGYPLPLSPEWSGDAGVSYTHSLGVWGEVRARTSYSLQSSVLFPYTYGSPLSGGGAYGLLNASLRWTSPSGKYYVEGMGRNLLNRLYLTDQANFLPAYVLQTFGPPILFELRIGSKF